MIIQISLCDQLLPRELLQSCSDKLHVAGWGLPVASCLSQHWQPRGIAPSHRLGDIPFCVNDTYYKGTSSWKFRVITGKAKGPLPSAAHPPV